jgi:hypothetical protein
MNKVRGLAKHLPSSTSDFRSKHIDKLCISFKGCNTSFITIPTSTVNIPDFLYLNNKDIPFIIPDDIGVEEKTLIRYLNLVRENETATIGTQESITDSMINYIFCKLGFNEYPYTLLLQTKYQFQIKNYNISSTPDFSIEKNGLAFIVDEDKHLNNTGPGAAWGEWQLAGEMLALACNNQKVKILKNIDTSTGEIIYAIRVIGTRFTFYKCHIPEKYIESLNDGLPSSNTIIERYPNNNLRESFSHLDYSKPDERKHIIEILNALKQI